MVILSAMVSGMLLAVFLLIAIRHIVRRDRTVDIVESTIGLFRG